MLFSSPRAEPWSRAQGWLLPHRQLTSCRPCPHCGLPTGTHRITGGCPKPSYGLHPIPSEPWNAHSSASPGSDALEHGKCEEHRAGQTPRIFSQAAFCSSLGPGRFPEWLRDTTGRSMQPALHGSLASPTFPPPGAGSLPSLPSALVGFGVRATIPSLGRGGEEPGSISAPWTRPQTYLGLHMW